MTERKRIAPSTAYDLTGLQFGRWLVLSLAPDDPAKKLDRRWLCRCTCPLQTEKIVIGRSLIHGMSLSCGCIRRENAKLLIDMVDQRFGMLVVIKRVEDKVSPGGYHTTMWQVRCDCGVVTVAPAGALRNGSSKSCGCQNPIMNGKGNRTHGRSKEPIHATWHCMIARCTYPVQYGYEHYGGRGIKVCDEWLHSFEKFVEWAFANGYQKGLTIERNDLDKDYEPSNCCFKTNQEQQWNKRNTIWIEWDGETKSLGEWAFLTGIPYLRLWKRYKKGWSVTDMFTAPPISGISYSKTMDGRRHSQPDAAVL